MGRGERDGERRNTLDVFVDPPKKIGSGVMAQTDVIVSQRPGRERQIRICLAPATAAAIPGRRSWFRHFPRGGAE